MKRAIKLTLICPIEIDDDVDVTNESELYDAESEAVAEELIGTEHLHDWCEQSIEDIGEWED